jgi:hypothetical protein
LCKFAKFYLIVDGNAAFRANADGVARPDILQSFTKFTSALKKALSIGKTGEAAFKPNEEGSYFNAFPTSFETLKQIEDAIVASGANGNDATRPGTVPKPDTAEESKKGRDTSMSNATVQMDESIVWAAKKTFRIGINFDADALFNKDPKDPKKYDWEASKT